MDSTILKRYFAFESARHDGTCGVQVLAEEEGSIFSDVVRRLSDLQHWDEASDIVVSWAKKFEAAMNVFESSKGAKGFIRDENYLTTYASKCCMHIALIRD